MRHIHWFISCMEIDYTPRGGTEDANTTLARRARRIEQIAIPKRIVMTTMTIIITMTIQPRMSLCTEAAIGLDGTCTVLGRDVLDLDEARL